MFSKWFALNTSEAERRKVRTQRRARCFAHCALDSQSAHTYTYKEELETFYMNFSNSHLPFIFTPFMEDKKQLATKANKQRHGKRAGLWRPW